METLLLAADTDFKQIPNMELSQKIYRYEYFLKIETEKADEIKKEIMEDIKQDSMGGLYKDLCEKHSWKIDEFLLNEMTAKLEEDLKKVETKKEDALENAGDTEVLDAMFEKAKLLTTHGSWELALTAYDDILGSGKKLTSNKKIDAMCDKLRILLFTMNLPKLATLIEETKKLNDISGDWDRRNRLKIYEALYLISIREVKKAAPLLLDCVETFTCVELCSYSSFMFYVVLINIFTLNRVDLYKKVIKNPQVIAMIGDLPHLHGLLHSIYNCDYDKFFKEMILILPYMMQDRYIAPHAQFIVQEYRILAYKQYLEAYKSVVLSTMASAFGMTSAMLDVEISKCIASGRITAKINKVNDVIENSLKHDKKNSQYNEVIVKGDVVLNQIQKLARTLDM